MTTRITTPVRLRCVHDSPNEKRLIKKAYKYMGELNTFKTGLSYKFVEADKTIILITRLPNLFNCIINSPDEINLPDAIQPQQGLCVCYLIPPDLRNVYRYVVFSQDEGKFIDTDVKIPQSVITLDVAHTPQDELLESMLLASELIYSNTFFQPPTPNISWFEKKHLTLSTYNLTVEEPYYTLPEYDWVMDAYEILNTRIINKYLLSASSYLHMFLGEYRIFKSGTILNSTQGGMVWLAPFVYEPEDVLEDSPITVYMIVTNTIPGIGDEFILQRMVIPGYFNRLIGNENEYDENGDFVRVIPAFETVATAPILGLDTSPTGNPISLTNKFAGWSVSDGTSGYLVGSSAEDSGGTESVFSTLKVFRFTVTEAIDVSTNEIVVSFNVTSSLPEYSTRNESFKASNDVSKNYYVTSKIKKVVKSWWPTSSVKLFRESSSTCDRYVKSYYWACRPDYYYTLRYRDQDGFFGFGDDMPFAPPGPSQFYSHSNGTRLRGTGFAVHEDKSTEEYTTKLDSFDNLIIGVIPFKDGPLELPIPVKITTIMIGSGSYNGERISSRHQEQDGGSVYYSGVDEKFWLDDGVEKSYTPQLFGSLDQAATSILLPITFFCRFRLTDTDTYITKSDYKVVYNIDNYVIENKLTLDEEDITTRINTVNHPQSIVDSLIQSGARNDPLLESYRTGEEDNYNLNRNVTSNAEVHGCKILYVDLTNDIILIEKTEFISNCTAFYVEESNSDEIGKTGLYNDTYNTGQNTKYTNTITTKLELIYKGLPITIRKHVFNNKYTSIAPLDDAHILLGGRNSLDSLSSFPLLPSDVNPTSFTNGISYGVDGGIIYEHEYDKDNVPNSSNCTNGGLGDVDDKKRDSRYWKSESEPAGTITEDTYPSKSAYFILLETMFQRMRYGSSGIDYKLEQTLLQTWRSANERILEQGSVWIRRIEVSAFEKDHHILLTTYPISSTLGSTEIESEQILIVNGIEIPLEGYDKFNTPGESNTRTSFVT